jgi:ElaB/YqjD/DUF883 family membrane-anchored ribosome-binding protein
MELREIIKKVEEVNKSEEQLSDEELAKYFKSIRPSLKEEERRLIESFILEEALDKIKSEKFDI